MLKFTISRTETRIVRETAKQIGGSTVGMSASAENRFELREEIERRLDVTCEVSAVQKGAAARILKAITEKFKQLFFHLLKLLQFPFTP